MAWAFGEPECPDLVWTDLEKPEMLDQALGDLFKTNDVTANALSDGEADGSQRQGTQTGLIAGR
jgi:hypothetical protein